MELWKKLENGLCWWNVYFAKETGKCLEEAEKWERVTGSDHSRCFKSFSCLQGNETARCEFVVDGFDCGNLEWKQREGALGNGVVEQSSDEPGTSSRSAGISSHLHKDHGIGAARLDKELAWRLDDFALAAICYADDVVLIAVPMFAAERMVTEVIEKLKEFGLTVLDELSEDDRQKHHGGWTGCGVGGSLGVLWDRWCVWTGFRSDGGFDGLDGFDGGSDGFDGGFDGLDGFDGGVVGMVEAEDIRAQKW